MSVLRRKSTKPPAAAKRRRRDGPSTQNHILDCAEKLFAERGFDSVSTSELTRAAGVAMGALYHHYPSKEALYAAATERLFAAKSSLPEGFLRLRAPAEQRLVKLVAWFTNSLMSDRHFALTLRRELLDPRPSTPHLLDKELFQQPLALFRELIRELQPKANTDELVATMLALLVGFANLKGIYTLFPGMRKTLSTPESIAEYTTRLLLRAIRTK